MTETYAIISRNETGILSVDFFDSTLGDYNSQISEIERNRGKVLASKHNIRGLSLKDHKELMSLKGKQVSLRNYLKVIKCQGNSNLI